MRVLNVELGTDVHSDSREAALEASSSTPQPALLMVNQFPVQQTLP